MTRADGKRDRDEMFVEYTKSICPVCKVVVDAQVNIRHDKVYLRKRCREHGSFEALVYGDAQMYLESARFNKPGTFPLRFQTEVRDGCPSDCGLCPDHKQHACLGLIEVNTHCNLDCPICFADSGHQPDGYAITAAQCERMLDTLVAAEGEPEVVMFSGGEPTIHKQLLEFVDAAQARPVKTVIINTNGIRLASDRRFVDQLATRNRPGHPVHIYLQFDGLDEATHRRIRGHDLRDVKQRALDNCAAAGLTYDEAADKMWQTTECWRQWINIGNFPDHPWRAYLQRSALTLKGLTYSPTGALLAASTTSLPETPRGERNWDYRYAWIRDSTFALWGLYTLGLDREADDFFAFIADVSGANNNERHPLQVMYGVGGERSLVEAELHHLSGYDHARPVRIGNGAYNQRQHDIWGSILDSFYLHAKSREQVPENLWPVLKRQVEEAIKHWREPDRGIWEVRGEPQHFTSSKVMCWVALDRGAKLAERQGEKSYAQQWRAIADEIKADILEHGVDSRGVFTQRYGDEALDASLLLVVLTRFLPPDDPRVRNTVLAIADELTEDGLVLRYRVHETDDGLSGEEGTFTICSFWLVSALVEIGEVGRAKRLCERLLSFASPLLLYAEEIEPRSGRHLGNFPQAFTHLALINAVVHVIRAEEEADSSGMFQPANAPM